MRNTTSFGRNTPAAQKPPTKFFTASMRGGPITEPMRASSRTQLTPREREDPERAERHLGTRHGAARRFVLGPAGFFLVPGRLPRDAADFVGAKGVEPIMRGGAVRVGAVGTRAVDVACARAG
jgi:hypothetical protein